MSTRRRNLFILLLALGLALASGAAIYFKETKLGLDLQGGVQLVYQAKETKEQKVTPEALDRSVQLMRQRVDQYGVAEPDVHVVGKDQIEVNLPSVKNAQRAVDQVGTTAQLLFYDWEPNILDEDCKTNPDQPFGGQQAIAGLYNAVKRAAACPVQKGVKGSDAGTLYYAFDKKTKKPLTTAPGSSREDVLADLTPAQIANAEVLRVNDGVIVLRDEARDKEKDPDRWWVLRDNPVLTGTDIKNPQQIFDPGSNVPAVSMDFTKKGRPIFAQVTRDIAQRGADNTLVPCPAIKKQGSISQYAHHFAIRLDQELISTPYIDFCENPDGIDPSTGSQISGNFTVKSAQDLATNLKIGALPLKLELVSQSEVSATLGKQALNQGLIAGVAGFIVVALFLVIFYRILGLIAVGGLLIYALYFYALIKIIPVVLTLPAIAGLILTIGVAADANIVIFERVKEEVRKGRSISASIATGYKKGFSTIVDANVVIILTAFILYILATAGVKAFAFTLGIGTIVSLFTAVLATQAILLSMQGSKLLSKPSALGAGMKHARWHFDFVGASKWFFSMSGVILLIGGFAIANKGLNFGIDFDSGTRITAPLAKAVNVESIRNTLAPLGFADAKIQQIKGTDLGDNVVQISTNKLKPDQVNRVTQSLKSKYGFTEQPNTESIGPTFGATVANSALIAIIASLTIIALYIALRFEWKYAVPVLIALAHDILITAGVYSLTEREVTTSTVAALLTILGFSLYDTIIVFDRIRENVPRMPAAAFSQIVNRSMSEVLTRSLATSVSTLLPTLALYFFGGDTLKDFAFALMIGIASGAYSSIFIAGPVLTHWKEREPLYRKREARIRRDLGFVPAYAAATAGGGPVDVEPVAKRSSGVSLSTAVPADGVSGAEFSEMVDNLGLESTQPRPPSGRRARGGGKPAQPTPTPDPKPETPAAPSTGAEKGGGSGAVDEDPKGTGGKKQRKPHGRSR